MWHLHILVKKQFLLSTILSSATMRHSIGMGRTMTNETQEVLAEEIETIREILVQHGRLPGDVQNLPADGDLYAAGLTSLATVGVMLAIEDKYDVEFPESLLNRGTFRSILSIAEAVSELIG